MKKILIFGSSGLVGSSVKLVFESDKENYDVISPLRNELDLFSTKETSNYISDSNPDWIINCAAKVGGILANNTYRTEFLLENLKINLNILEGCIGNNNINIINLGSSCIYPLNADNPIKESSFMTGELEPTNSPYALSKIAAIELGKEIKHQYGNKVINLMPTNLYGPRDSFSEKDSHVIPGLIYRLNENINSSEFKIWGSGKPLREFLYVLDLADCIKFIIESNLDEDLINVGSGEEISIKDLATLISEILNYKGELVFDTEMPDGNPRKLLDSSLLKSYGWYPTTNLEEGLEETVNWYLSTL
jgi:GDP-L-fucose synthase